MRTAALFVCMRVLTSNNDFLALIYFHTLSQNEPVKACTQYFHKTPLYNIKIRKAAKMWQKN